MSDGTQTLPASISRVLDRFERLSREEKMQALLHYSKKLEPVPERLGSVDLDTFAVPECTTPVALVPENNGGILHFYAAVNAKQSPTVAAFLAILFSAVNDQPAAVARALPPDFARLIMESIGLGTRETGLNAMVQRVRNFARSVEEN